MALPRDVRPGHALALAGLLMPPLATVAPLALAPLLALAAVGALALGAHRELWRVDRARVLAISLALLGLLGIASALWSTVPAHSLLEGVRFLLICAAGLVMLATALSLDAGERERIGRWLLWGFVLGLAILIAAAASRTIWDPSPEEGGAARWLRHYTLFDRGSTTLALALWPALLALTSRGKLRVVVPLVILTLIALLALKSRAAMLCLVVALALWPLARALPRASAALIGAGLVGLVAVFPTLPLDMDLVAKAHEAVPRFNSAIHRLAIWHFAIDRIAERPLLGWGLDASRALPGGSNLIEDPRLPGLAQGGALWMPLHPHNAALQWRLELGLPGAALATLAVLWILWRARSPAIGPPAVRATALALIAGALVVAMISYGIWQAWWESSLWLLAALTAALAPSGSRPAPER